MFPGVWRHGDWIKIIPRGSCVIYGRSDSTLKRGGIRMGTSEFYRIVEEFPEVLDSLVIDTGYLEKNEPLFLFLVLQDGLELDSALVDRINEVLTHELSPRHLPDEIYQIAGVSSHPEWGEIGGAGETYTFRRPGRRSHLGKGSGASVFH